MNKNLVIVIALVLVLALGVYLLSDTTDVADSDGRSIDRQNGDQTTTVSDTQATTIANEWQWETLDADEESGEADQAKTLPFTPQSVHDALQAVKVDENGDVVLDHAAQISLDEALERIYNQLDSDSILELQELIKKALPGKVGEQTARLVGDYNGFLQAKDEFSQIHEGNNEVYREPTIASIESDQLLYKELQALRELHLGRDVTAQLFEVADANANFMFESMKIGMDDSLSPEQRADRLTEIQAQLDAVVGNPEDLNL